MKVTKIGTINYPIIHDRKINNSGYKQDTLTISRGKNCNLNFCAQPASIPNLKECIRIIRLKQEGINDSAAKIIAKFDKARFQRVMELLKLGVYIECVAEVSGLEEESYKKALELINHKIVDDNLPAIAQMDEKACAKAIDLKAKGIDSDFIADFAKLDEDSWNCAVNLMKEGYPPSVAVHLAKLNDNQRAVAVEFFNKQVSIEDAVKIAQYNDESVEKCRRLIQQGVSANETAVLGNLDSKYDERVNELINLNIGDDNIVYFAKLSEEDYKQALKMFREGVLPEYITDIIPLEKGQKKNSQYNEYREMGYSRSSAFVLSLLTKEELQALGTIVKKNPKIKELLKDEYDINIIRKQDTDVAEAILSKERRCENGTLITWIRTFDEDGIQTESRLEEYKNHATSSYLHSGNNIFKLKYDKYGNVREMLQIIQDAENKNAIGVIHSTASKLLNGVFESIYYDIDDLKTSTNDIENNDDIEPISKHSGIPLSTVTKNNDGSVTYTENWSFNGCNTQRTYKEKKENSGLTVYSSYSYKITDENQQTILDIQREFKRNQDGSATNTINGIKYLIKYDDEEKTITVSDGRETKIINMKQKLSYYFEDIQWQTIKNLPADTLLTIAAEVKHWNYCRDEDSAADGYTRTISTNEKEGIISHETGHFKDYVDGHLYKNKKFLRIYSEEMAKFFETIPYNEQEFVQYFSPRAELNDAEGIDEFAAESNIILTTFGTDNDRLKTRTQFLVKYFPKSIAKAAELLGKTSKKSLIE